MTTKQLNQALTTAGEQILTIIPEHVTVLIVASNPDTEIVHVWRHDRVADDVTADMLSDAALALTNPDATDIC
jgi:hypothetical protein